MEQPEELGSNGWAPGFAHYVIAITAIPASAPLRFTGTRPSMAAFLTLSQRSLRFESWLMEMLMNWGMAGAPDLNSGMPESKSGALPLGDAPLHEERFSSKDQL